MFRLSTSQFTGVQSGFSSSQTRFKSLEVRCPMSILVPCCGRFVIPSDLPRSTRGHILGVSKWINDDLVNLEQVVAFIGAELLTFVSRWRTFLHPSILIGCFLAAWFIHIREPYSHKMCNCQKKENLISFCLVLGSQEASPPPKKKLFGCDQVTHKSSFVTLTFLSRFFFRLYGHVGRSTQRLLVSPLTFCKALVGALDDLTLPEDRSGRLEAWWENQLGKEQKKVNGWKWFSFPRGKYRLYVLICTIMCDMSICIIFN